MAAFPPVPPKKAIAIVESAGVEDAARAILDFAAGGLVRARALAIEVGGEQIEDGGLISSDLWKRIMRESCEVWIGGSVHLPAREAGGAPALSITGIRFEVMDLYRLVRYHCGSATTAAPKTAVAEPARRADQSTPAKRRCKTADPTAIPPGALLATVNQTMSALGFGRTKVNELMNDGRLVKRHIDGGVRIEVASIRALAGF